MAFKRREAALMLLGDLLGNLQSVYGALHYWKIKDPAGKWIALIDAYSDEEGNALKYRNAYNSFFKNLVNLVEIRNLLFQQNQAHTFVRVSWTGNFFSQP